MIGVYDKAVEYIKQLSPKPILRGEEVVGLRFSMLAIVGPPGAEETVKHKFTLGQIREALEKEDGKVRLTYQLNESYLDVELYGDKAIKDILNVKVRTPSGGGR